MKISTKQVPVEELVNIYFDAAFYSCGYETRATFLKESFDIVASRNILLVFNDEERGSFKKNKNFYTDHLENCELIYADSDRDDSINKVFKDILEVDKSELNILIDYSSMTSVWFASFLGYFRYYKSSRKIRLYYSYSHAKFIIPKEVSRHIINVKPMVGFTNLSIPDKPTALIIGLGYERNKATGLAQYLDAESYLFYTDNSYENDFYDCVIHENEVLLNEVKKENVFCYPIRDIDATASLLHLLVSDLLQTNRIVLAPCGPKIFTLLCLIESLKNENVDVWRVSDSKDLEERPDRVPDGNISVYSITI